MLRKEEILLIIYFILVITFLSGFTIIFFITYQRRKNKLLQEKFQAEQDFKTELSNVRMEIQEATLKNVSWELHDNIGQLLAIASMQLNILSKKVDEASHSTVNEVKDLVANSLSEIRALSRSLNNEVVDYVGLEASVKNEIERFNRLAVLEAKLDIQGKPYQVSQEDSIILFRIIQEFLSNTIKYAAASKLNVNFIYGRDLLEILIEDNGIGFDIEETKAGSGMLNMRSRAEIINAGFLLKSSPGKGTSLSLTYPTKITTNE
ncbi:sensor histidine kinase [Christiangramia aquimixticola]|uniref:sensor histidine kinase n=1 Tax=Christiangramia aquimixticola TaxID=1697558 RepID=UPI003AA95BF0